MNSDNIAEIIWGNTLAFVDINLLSYIGDNVWHQASKGVTQQIVDSDLIQDEAIDYILDRYLNLKWP